MHKYEDGVMVSMEEYAISLKERENIRRVDWHERLTRTVIKEYKKFTGKLSWLVAERDQI